MNKKLLIGIILTFILILVFSFLLKTPQEVIITTDKTEYTSEDVVKMTIKNNLANSICLSYCYPYYLQINNGEWESYLYEECQEFNSVRDCIKPNEATDPLELTYKGYEFTEIALPSGLYRIAVPFCFDCQIGEVFREDEIFYSNEFTIGQ